MKLIYQKELFELQKWIDNTNKVFSIRYRSWYTQENVNEVRRWIDAISSGVKSEYPFYASFLSRISYLLFLTDNSVTYSLNAVAYGELVAVIRHIEAEPVVMQAWINVHERIKRVSEELYKDGHYASAAENAVKEIEVRLREVFAECNPGNTMPKEITEVIAALFSENGLYGAEKTATVSERNYSKGMRMLFEGIIAAYRNPSAHANIKIEKREALERIMLASQLMFMLDKKAER